MAELKKITLERLKKILIEHRKWLRTGGQEGAQANLRRFNLSRVNLSGINLTEADFTEANLLCANLSRANFCKADFSGANLLSANLSDANLKEVDFRSANLSGANLFRADLSQAFLYRSDLSGANLSGADLSRAEIRWADLSWVDLSASKLCKTKVREEDLFAVKYHPEQIKDMLLYRPKKEPVIVPQQRGRLIIRLADEKSPILHMIYLFDFLEYQYDILYILLFGQHDSFDKLRDILSGSPYHWLKDKDEAPKIVWKKTETLEIAISGLNPIWILFYALVAYSLRKTDLLQSMAIIVFKLKKVEFKENPQDKIERIRAELIEKNKNREEQEESLPDLFDIGNEEVSPPRKDLLEAVLFLRQEGLLTNKLSDEKVANLLEIHMENFGRELQSVRDQLGEFKLGLGKEYEKDNK